MKMMCIVLGVLCVGCASRPKWVPNHPIEADLLAGREVALLYGMGAAQTHDEAEKRARQSLEDQIEIIVEAMQIDYSIVMIRSGGADYSDNFFTSVKRELKREIRPNAHIVDRGTGPQNVCYALAVYKNIDIQRIITEAAIVEAAGNADFRIEVVRKSVERELNKSSTKEWREQKSAEAEVKAEAEAKAKAEAKMKAEAEAKAEAARRLAEESLKLAQAEAARKQAQAEAARRRAEGVSEKAELAFRNHCDYVSGFVQWGDGLVGGGGSLALGIHWSLVPFTVIGLETRLGGIGGPDRKGVIMGGIAPTLGLVFPLTENIKIFGDGLLEIGYFGGLSGLIAENVSPGFDGGILFWWDGIGFDIKYRGVWYENHYLHSISIGILIWSGKAWDWW